MPLLAQCLKYAIDIVLFSECGIVILGFNGNIAIGASDGTRVQLGSLRSIAGNIGGGDEEISAYKNFSFSTFYITEFSIISKKN